MLSEYCQIHASGYYLQWRQERIDIGEGHDKNGQHLNCAVSTNRRLKGWWNERKMATLACTDYSPENNHDGKSHIGTDALHK